MQSPGEFEIIDRYFRDIGRRADVLLGVGDDAAVLEVPPGECLVATVDTLIEDVHFPSGLDAADVGWRSLAVNLSDLAAMGARPAWTTLSLSLPRADTGWLAGFAAGFAQLAETWGVALVGGDTVRGPLVVTVQAMGLVERGQWLTRSGARPGHLVVVSGTLGDSAAGLAAWRGGAVASQCERTLVQRFTRPAPRIELGRRLRTCASAAMDVSDGLVADLEKLCAASACAADIDVGSLPLSEALRTVHPVDRRELYALTGGDDYELVFTIAEESFAALCAQQGLPVACTPIGRVRRGRGVVCRRDGEAISLPVAGYDHFGAGAAG